MLIRENNIEKIVQSYDFRTAVTEQSLYKWYNNDILLPFRCKLLNIQNTQGLVQMN